MTEGAERGGGKRTSLMGKCTILDPASLLLQGFFTRPSSFNRKRIFRKCNTWSNDSRYIQLILSQQPADAGDPSYESEADPTWKK